MTTLRDIEETGEPVSISHIGGDPALCVEVQTRLGFFSLLDPPADGKFGPVSRWALGEFQKRIGSKQLDAIDRDTARRLRQTQELFPLKLDLGYVSDIVRAMINHGYWINRHPACRNIVYVEGMLPGGVRNSNPPNRFNDLRALFSFNQSGAPTIIGEWEATTQPGRSYVLDPVEAKGAAQIRPKQYKSWSVGMHNRNKPNRHEALVQVEDVDIYRDLNKDFQRTGDELYMGLFGINQHHGYDMSKDEVGKTSAGCLVGRSRGEHSEFMRLVKDDPRYVVNNGYRFITTILEAV